MVRASSSSLWKSARACADDVSYPRAPGIGLEVHEHPYLNGGNTQQALLPGETFSNEPGVYIERAADPDPEGHGIGVRLEDMVRKTERGWELVSREPLAQSPWEP